MSSHPAAGQQMINAKTPENINRYNTLANEAGNKDPLALFYKLLELQRLESLNIIPRAGQEIRAYIIHTKEITVNNSGLANVDPASLDPAIGYFGKTDPKTLTNKWVKAYGYVDFYSSCLPFPQESLIGKQDIVAAQKGKTKNTFDPELLLDAWDLLRISRFPYFLVPVRNTSAGAAQDLPQVGKMAIVKFLDKDNFSYGVFLKSMTKEIPETGKKPAVINYKQPIPLIPNAGIPAVIDPTLTA